MRLEGNRLVVSRRNLLSLLAKLDGYPRDSNCTIATHDFGMFLTAEEDEVHYAHPSRDSQEPGVMHPDTEERLS